MTQHEFKEAFTLFLNGYWGAFHELLEAESVKPERLATSLLRDTVEQHAEFQRLCPESARPALDELDRLWRRVIDHREIVPDDPLTAEQVRLALDQFQAIYDALYILGERRPSARAKVLEQAPHATPRSPLRADAPS